jgi:hypothetical protein
MIARLCVAERGDDERAPMLRTWRVCVANVTRVPVTVMRSVFGDLLDGDGGQALSDDENEDGQLNNSEDVMVIDDE